MASSKPSHHVLASEEGRRASSLAGLLLGLPLSMVISGSLVIATAKAGISPGVSPLVVLVGWVVFGQLMRGRLKPFLAILQVTGSAGAAVSVGLIFTAPILQIAAELMGEPVPAVNVPTTMLSCVAGSLLGWGFVGLASNRLLTDPRLPAPEAVACDRLTRTAVSRPEDRPPVWLSLFPALVSGFAVRGLVFLKWMSSIAVTAKVPIKTIATDHPVRLPIPVSPLFLGIGALLTFPTALLIFLGSVVHGVTQSVADHNALPAETYRWVGGAAMVVAVLYSLLNYAWESRRQRKADSEVPDHSDTAQLEISAGMKKGLWSAICSGAVLLILILIGQGTPIREVMVLGVTSLVLIGLLSGLGGLLSLQVGASASPVSGTLFVAMLVLSVVSMALGQTGYPAVILLQPVLVATCVAIAAANDSSQDYKTMQLNGFRVSSVFTCQLLGCLAGAITVPVALWVAHRAYTLGSDALPCPQASTFGTVLASLFDPRAGVPWQPVKIGLGLGCLAVSVEMLARLRNVVLSSLAFAVGIYLPAEMGIGILVGNLARVVATASLSRSSHRGILSAAGLIAGDSLFSLAAGVLIVCGIHLARFQAKLTWPGFVSTIALLCFVLFVAFAYSDARRNELSRSDVA